MYPWLLSDPREDDERVMALRRRLDNFYETDDHYFGIHTDNSGYHALLEPLLREQILRLGRKPRVLELGAGVASFPINLAGLRQDFEYHAQDVTPQNAAHLERVSDRVIIDDISAIRGEYDLIFSTYVLEHVATPRAFLGHVRRLLRVGGIHAVVCPRYDVPGYLCPSLRHHALPRRLALHLRLAIARLASRVTGRPRFYVNADPAIFHGPWFTDADAVHVVSQFEVARWHRANGFRARRLRLAPGRGIKGRIHTLLLTTALVCTRTK